MLVCLGRHCFEGVEDVGSCAWGGLWLACKGPWVQYLYIRNKSKSSFLFCVKRLRGSVVRWIFFETAVRKRSQAADLRAFFPVERTLGPHSECACSRWGVGFRHCLLITWGPTSLSLQSWMLSVIISWVQCLSFQSLQTSALEESRLPRCAVVPYWFLFLLSLNVYFNSSVTASATENQAWVACVFTSSTGEAQAGKSVWAPGQTNLHRYLQASQSHTVRPTSH